MNTRTLGTMLSIVGILAASGWAAAQNRNGNQGPTAVAPAPAAAQLTAIETANLLHMRQEEKLARDVYRTLGQKWNCPIFTNITGAEQRHMDAVKTLVTKYGLQDPVTDDTVGVFTDSAFLSLYATMIKTGSTSLLDALKIGVQIEQMDIADLKKALVETDKSDIEGVYGNLLRGSTNHLQAFTRGVASGGTSCQPQGVSANAGNGKGPGAGVCPGCGRGGRGNGNGYRNGGGNSSQNGMGRGNGQQKRDGTCLMVSPAQP